jgi:malate permease and related proteins
MLEINLLKLYVPLVIWISLGILLGRTLPNTIPLQLGKFLFWIGVPISILTFLRQADLSGAVWLAPATPDLFQPSPSPTQSACLAHDLR